MWDTIGIRLLLAFLASSREAKGLKWCEKRVGGMHDILAKWETGVMQPRDKGAAASLLKRHCHTCRLCPRGFD